MVILVTNVGGSKTFQRLFYLCVAECVCVCKKNPRWKKPSKSIEIYIENNTNRVIMRLCQHICRLLCHFIFPKNELPNFSGHFLGFFFPKGYGLFVRFFFYQGLRREELGKPNNLRLFLRMQSSGTIRFFKELIASSLWTRLFYFFSRIWFFFYQRRAGKTKERTSHVKNAEVVVPVTSSKEKPFHIFFFYVSLPLAAGNFGLMVFPRKVVQVEC